MAQIKQTLEAAEQVGTATVRSFAAEQVGTATVNFAAEQVGAEESASASGSH